MPCARAGLEAPISISVPRALRSPSPVVLGASCQRVLRRVLLGGTTGAVLCGELGDGGVSSWCHCPCSIPTASFWGVRGPGGSRVLGEGESPLVPGWGDPRGGGLLVVGGSWVTIADGMRSVMSARRSGHAKLLAQAGAGAGAGCPPRQSPQPGVGPGAPSLPSAAVAGSGEELRGERSGMGLAHGHHGGQPGTPRR